LIFGISLTVGKTMCRILLLPLFVALASFAWAQDNRPAVPTPTPLPGDLMIAEYFRAETKRIADACLADVQTLEDWTSRRETYREQFLEMLGLSPMPERADLRPVVTGIVDHPEFTVEKIHFQSLPKLYVTANLYIPKGLTKPAPAILYLCGHSRQEKDGRSFGNKTGYQHHPAWFARNGYVCLVIDTIQLGEIPGIHHGTFREGMWWWNSRGYTPAGVETWNAIRALDFLEVRPEVDRDHIGVTGRSGGGAYTWFVTAVDDRVKVAVPVAGITDLENHVVDGAIEGHCDCMFFINTYRWDFPQLAALVAPRPLLLANTDKDKIFPLDGVIRVHEKVKRIYDLYGAADKLGLCITEGPHEDTQPLQVHAFQWFNRFLKNDESPIKDVAEKFFDPAELAVFEELPRDSINGKIHETFVPQASPIDWPEDVNQRREQRAAILEKVRRTSLSGWPDESIPLNVEKKISFLKNETRISAYDFDSQPGVRLRFYLIKPGEMRQPNYTEVNVLSQKEWDEQLRYISAFLPQELRNEVKGVGDAEQTESLFDHYGPGSPQLVLFAPRGIGEGAWTADPKEETHIRRRFNLLGQTLEGMRAWDVRRAIQALREVNDFAQGTIALMSFDPELGTPATVPILLETGVTGGDWLDEDLLLLGVGRTVRPFDLLKIATEKIKGQEAFPTRHPPIFHRTQ
jgi:hypothetical protein